MKRDLRILCLTLLLLYFQNISGQENFEQIQVGAYAVSSAKVLRLPKPEYPESALRMGIRGIVWVHVLINKTGSVESARVLKGHPLLRAISFETALRAKFQVPNLHDARETTRGVIVYKYNSGNPHKGPFRIVNKKLVYVHNGVINTRAISLPKPIYPFATTLAVGRVSVIVLVDRDGSVKSAKASSGHPLLRHAAIKAALNARFRPYLIGGESFNLQGVLVYRFEGEPVIPTKNFSQKLLRLGIINGLAKSLPIPVYPKKARENCVGGLVKVLVSVDRNGKVVSAVAVEGNTVLLGPSVRAAKSAKFRFMHSPKTPIAGFLLYNFDGLKKVCNLKSSTQPKLN